MKFICKASNKKAKPLREVQKQNMTETIVAKEKEIAFIPDGLMYTNIYAGSGIGYKENQDGAVYHSIVHEGVTYKIYFVTDGHGDGGLSVRNLVVELLPQRITSNFSDILKDPDVTLKSIFVLLSADINKLLEDDILKGGATLTLVIETHDNYIVANVGDSPAYLLLYTDDRITLTRDGVSEVKHGPLIELTECHDTLYKKGALKALQANYAVAYSPSNIPVWDVISRTSVGAAGITDIALRDISLSSQAGMRRCNANGDLAAYVNNNYSSIAMTKAIADELYSDFMSAEPSVAIFQKPQLCRIMIGAPPLTHTFVKMSSY